MRPSRCSYVLGCVMLDRMSRRPFLDGFAWFRCRARPSRCSYVLGCAMLDRMSRRPFLDGFGFRCRARPSRCSYVLGRAMLDHMSHRPFLYWFAWFSRDVHSNIHGSRDVHNIHGSRPFGLDWHSVHNIHGSRNVFEYTAIVLLSLVVIRSEFR